jgi:hypothetical protein
MGLFASPIGGVKINQNQRRWIPRETLGQNYSGCSQKHILVGSEVFPEKA